jgi:hypothetical protein
MEKTLPFNFLEYFVSEKDWSCATAGRYNTKEKGFRYL